MKRLPKLLYLVIGIPLSSVLCGLVLLYAATAHNSVADARSEQSAEAQTQAPLSKTSWKAQP